MAAGAVTPITISGNCVNGVLWQGADSFTPSQSDLNGTTITRLVSFAPPCPPNNLGEPPGDPGLSAASSDPVPTATYQAWASSIKGQPGMVGALYSIGQNPGGGGTWPTGQIIVTVTLTYPTHLKRFLMWLLAMLHRWQHGK
jgi:hypothetical protein